MCDRNPTYHGRLRLGLALIISSGCGGPDLAPLEDTSAEAIGAKAVPGQYVAMLYTEALGRAPDQGGWRAYTDYFKAVGCNTSTLRLVGTRFFTSREFEDRRYSPESQVLVLYRAVLGREPDAGGYAHFLSRLRRGDKVVRVAASIMKSPEFRERAARLCSGRPAGWSHHPVLDIPVDAAEPSAFLGSAAGQQQRDLERVMAEAAARGGGTVWLARRAVVRLTRPLLVPAGVRLATVGLPTRIRYAEMARLVRDADIGSGHMVKLADRAGVNGVWVDGQIGKFPITRGRNPTLATWGSGIRVLNSRLSDGMGTQLYLAGGARDGVSCSDTIASGNLITAYGALYMDAVEFMSDGITNRCQSARIEGNHIVDATDVGIIVFHPGGSARQRSIVRGNVIVNAGNPAVAGIAVDPETGYREQTGTVHDFTGFVAEGNILWSSPTAHIDVVLSLGTRAWFEDGLAIGGVIRNNGTGGLSVRTNTAILVGSMVDPVVEGNRVSAHIRQINRCRRGHTIVASDTIGRARIQRPNIVVPVGEVTSCVSY